jgi:polar amino acid transport system substrate-binding protein
MKGIIIKSAGSSLISAVLLLVICIFFSTTSNAKTLRVASDIWCPYICDQVDKKGVLVDILQLIAKDQNITLQIEIMPLSRSLKLTAQQHFDVVLALTPAHLAHYKLKSSVEMYGGTYNDFYMLENNNWSFSTIEQLQEYLKDGHVLGLIQGYEYSEGLDKLALDFKEYVYRATGETPLKNIVTMLKLGRIDVVLGSRFNVEYELNELGLLNVKRVGTDGGFTPLYLGYAPNVDDALIKSIDQGLIKLRASGTLDTILAKYGMPDWRLDNSLTSKP